MKPSRMEYRKAPTPTISGSVASEHSHEIADLNEGLAIGSRAVKRSERFGHAYHRLLVFADAVAILVAVALAFVVAAAFGADSEAGRWVATVILLAPIWVLIAYQAGLYGQVERRYNIDYVTELPQTVVSITFWCWIIVMVGSFTASNGPNVFGPLVLWFLAIPLILLSRAAARSVARTRPWFQRRVALVGDFSAVEVLRQRIDRHPEWGVEVSLRLTHDDDTGGWEMWGRLPELASLSEPIEPAETGPVAMTRLVKRSEIDRVIIAGGTGSLNTRIELAHTMLDRGVAVDFLSGGPETFYGTSITQHLEGMTLMSSRPSYPGPLDRVLKRTIDIVLASTLLVVTSPLLLLAAVRIKRDSRGPVFYCQARSGMDQDDFKLIKLRTMYDGAHAERDALRQATEAHGNDDVLFKLDDDPRVTKVGKWLRRTSLDELPQLWNVLRGDMSMVGPRPLVPEEAEMASGMYTARFNVKPGIAGPWQAEGRSEIPFEDMLKLDYSYVAGWSQVEDLKLLLRTFSAVIGRKGAK